MRPARPAVPCRGALRLGQVLFGVNARRGSLTARRTSPLAETYTGADVIAKTPMADFLLSL